MSRDRDRDRRQSQPAMVSTLPQESGRNDASRRKTASTFVAKPPAIFPGVSITKPPANRPKRNRTSHVIANELEEQLNIYTSTLVANANDNINKAECSLADSIDSLFDDFNKSCNVLENADSSLQFDIEREEIQLGEKDDETGSKYRMLQQCMEEYQKQVRTSTDRLQGLWNDWSEVQHEILRLAMEVFGPETVEQDSEEADGLRRDMAQSQQLYEQNRKTMEESKTELSQIQNQLEELTEKSVNESKQHLKEIRIKNREQARVFSKAISAMGEF